MTTFRFAAAREDGAMIKGTLDAATAPDVAGVLSQRGLFPISVQPARPRRARKLPLRAQAYWFHGLASLIEAGVPLSQALASTEALGDRRLKDVTQRVGTRVRDGTTLGAALAAEDNCFSPVATGLVRAGERGVGLSAALQQAADQLEREADTAGRIRTALAYPALLAVVGTISVAVITIFVVPRFAALLSDLGQSLPLATRLLVSASTFVRSYGLVVIALVAAATFAASRVIETRRAEWDEWLLRVPLVGTIRHSLATARAARTMSALLGSGVAALAALDIAREAVANAAIAQRLLDTRAQVSSGAAFSRALASNRVFTPATLQLATIGDQSGRLPALLAKAADLEEREADRRIKTLVSFLEPGLILLFAGIVAFVAAALLQAVYSLRPS